MFMNEVESRMRIPLAFGKTLPTLRACVNALIDEALSRSGGSIHEASRMLGISPQSLTERMHRRMYREHGIPIPPKKFSRKSRHEKTPALHIAVYVGSPEERDVIHETLCRYHHRIEYASWDSCDHKTADVTASTRITTDEDAYHVSMRKAIEAWMQRPHRKHDMRHTALCVPRESKDAWTSIRMPEGIRKSIIMDDGDMGSIIAWCQRRSVTMCLITHAQHRRNHVQTPETMSVVHAIDIFGHAITRAISRARATRFSTCDQ
jgi:hypothetical protein